MMEVVFYNLTTSSTTTTPTKWKRRGKLEQKIGKIIRCMGLYEETYYRNTEDKQRNFLRDEEGKEWRMETSEEGEIAVIKTEVKKSMYQSMKQK